MSIESPLVEIGADAVWVGAGLQPIPTEIAPIATRVCKTNLAKRWDKPIGKTNRGKFRALTLRTCPDRKLEPLVLQPPPWAKSARGDGRNLASKAVA